MRVIAGFAKGRNLKAPKGMATRPTTDRVKEALFNILGQTVIDSFFMDLFAGSGAIGIEALSRGAREALFIEKETPAIRVLKENLNLTGFTGQAQVYQEDVNRALDIIIRKGYQFEIIFMDPPYLKNYEAFILEKISTNRLLKESGLIVVERSKRDSLPGQVDNLILYREEKYGDTVLSFYKYLL